MAVATTGLLIASLVISTAAAVQQQRQTRKSRKAQERAAKVANKQAQIKRQREIRQSIAKSRVQRAQAISAGFAVGAPGASGVAGAAGGIQTDVAAGIGASGVQFGLEQQRIGFLNQAAGAQSRANEAAIFGQIGSTVGSLATEQNVASVKGFFA